MGGETVLSLTDYAALSVEIAEGASSRSEVLAARGIDLEAYLGAEAIHMRAIAADALEGGTGAAATFEAARAAAREALPLPEVDEPAWEALRVDFEQRGLTALAERGISSATYTRMQLAHAARPRRARPF